MNCDPFNLRRSAARNAFNVTDYTVHEAPSRWHGVSLMGSLSAKHPPSLEGGRLTVPSKLLSWGRLTFYVRGYLLLIMAVFMLLSGTRAHAGVVGDEYRQEIWLGRSFTSMHESASVAGVSLISPRIRNIDHDLRKEFFIGFLSRQDAEQEYDRNVSFIGGGVRYQRQGVIASFGLGLASARTPALSSHYQFVSGLGYRFGSALLLVRHLSNASTSGPNRGENFLLLQWDLG